MRQNKTQKGFTIVETLIVLAVTGFLFVSTALLVSGQINKNQFRQASLNTEQVLADAINDVNSGYFDLSNTPPAGCSASINSPGTSDCICAGKKYEIDASNSTITASSVYINDTANPFGGSPLPILRPTNSVTKDLPGGLDYANDVSFYVLFEQYPDTSGAANTADSEAQSVGIYEQPSASIAPIVPGANGLRLCAANGDRKVKYVLGVKGAPTVTKEYTDAGCP